MKKFDVRTIVMLGLFIALFVICDKFLAIKLPSIKISFTFLPIAICAIMYGPWKTGMAAAIADVLGFILLTGDAAYHPGFTLTACLTGIVFGLFLYEKPKTLLRFAISAFIVSIFIQFALNSVWLYQMQGAGFFPKILPRFIDAIIRTPVYIAVLYYTWKYLGSHINKEFA